MIIIEGLDATGKSTLAKKIALNTNWPIQPSEGPEKFPGEATLRAKRYLTHSRKTIYDRHPLISQFIYGPPAGKTLPPMILIERLKARTPLIIEASPDNHFEHIAKAHDTPEHLQMIETKRGELAKAYKTFLDYHFPSRLIYTTTNLNEVVSLAISYALKEPT